MVGQKNGPFDLPAHIFSDEFESIREKVLHRRSDLELIHQWYIKDSNNLPGLYVLQTISSILGEFCL